MRAAVASLVCCTVTAELSAAATRISSIERIIRVNPRVPTMPEVIELLNEAY